MIRVMFVCHGNICRSVAAKYIMKHLIKNKNINKEFFVDSAAVSYEEIGNDIYPLMKEILIDNNIEIGNHKSKIILNSDYDKFDYFLVMDDKNLNKLIKIFDADINNKIYKLKFFLNNKNENIEDPWYTRNFKKVYKEIYESVNMFINKIKNDKEKNDEK